MIAQLDVQSPKTLAEAYTILAAAQKRIKVLAGGTDLMVLLNTRAEIHPAYLNIWALDELRGIRDSGNALRIGALTTYTKMIRSPLVRKYAPILVAASEKVGAAQIQNRGTIGGNIVNASPAGDTLPVLAVFDAILEIGSVRGTRRVAFNQFYTGYRETVLAPDELLLAIHLPKPVKGDWQYFRKVGTRQAQAISKVVMAVMARVDEHGKIESIRIAYGSVAPTVIRTLKTEALLSGSVLSDELIEAAKQEVMNEVRPITDVRSTAEYRRTVSGNILKRCLFELMKDKRGE